MAQEVRTVVSDDQQQLEILNKAWEKYAEYLGVSGFEKPKIELESMETQATFYPKENRIVIRKQASLRWKLIYLAHEAIHFKQYHLRKIEKPEWLNPDFTNVLPYPFYLRRPDELESWSRQYEVAEKAVDLHPSLRQLLERKYYSKRNSNNTL